jgi:hypothetical protein
MVRLPAGSVWSMSGTSFDTVICSLIAARLRLSSTVCVVPTRSTTSSWRAVLNPVAVASSEYRPTGRRGATKRPSARVTTVLE